MRQAGAAISVTSGKAEPHWHKFGIWIFYVKLVNAGHLTEVPVLF
jgi:hypothetical protein